ncbi:hypothetical protein LXL04_033765 [Taraxacum kok-saghyz]
MNRRFHPDSVDSQSRFEKTTVVRFSLYQQSVQDCSRYWFLNVEIRWSPKGDISYLQKFFLTYVGGRAPLHLQEDLCGTALLSTEWLRSDSRRTAVGLDLDVEALDWCMENNVNKVGADLSECELRMQRRFPNFTYTWEQAGFYILQRKARISGHCRRLKIVWKKLDLSEFTFGSVKCQTVRILKALKVLVVVVHFWTHNFRCYASNLCFFFIFCGNQRGTG